MHIQVQQPGQLPRFPVHPDPGDTTVTEAEERLAVIAEARTWYIYVMRDPETLAVRYAGFTTRPEQRRSDEKNEYTFTVSTQ